MSRYSNRPIASNVNTMYDEVFKKKGVNGVVQYGTPAFVRATQEAIDELRYTEYIWSAGDRYWKLAESAYGDRSMWYIIARFNNKPTEAHIKVGDVIKIPSNITRAMELLK